MLTLSTWGCQYWSCIVLAGFVVICEKNVGFVKYNFSEEIENSLAIAC